MTMPSILTHRERFSAVLYQFKMDQLWRLYNSYDYVTKAVNNVVFHSPVEIGYTTMPCGDSQER